jgi:hypothetical protein
MACFYNLWQPTKSRFFTVVRDIDFSDRTNEFRFEFISISMFAAVATRFRSNFPAKKGGPEGRLFRSVTL